VTRGNWRFTLHASRETLKTPFCKEQVNQKIRLFTAIELPEPIKKALIEAAAQLGRRLPEGVVRWVKPAQLHLTLRFLGDTAVSQLPTLQDQLGQLAYQHPTFRLRLNGVGAFPTRQKPRVVWAGLAGDLAVLQGVQADLEDRLVGLGWSKEQRPFNPHITLGRVKDAGQVREIAWAVDLAALEFWVTAVQLVQSELRPSGPVYTVRQVVQLRQPA
jgi:RNA 2',3'-cyclic 3'-phosphodiesterase